MNERNFVEDPPGSNNDGKTIKSWKDPGETPMMILGEHIFFEHSPQWWKNVGKYPRDPEW